MPKNPPELQLWRRADAGARYSKTGVSSISSIPNRTPHTNVYEYVLDPPLEFQKGDIFGLYKPRESESVLNIFLQEDNGPFAYGQESGTNLPLSRIRADSTNLLDQNDYPMVSVEIALSGE